MTSPSQWKASWPNTTNLSEIMEATAAALLTKTFQANVDLSEYAVDSIGRIELTDSASCHPARIREGSACDGNCNMTIMQIDAADTVSVIDFNGWLKNMPYQKCDYILFDTGIDRKRFALCELTCSMSKYVDAVNSNEKEGKRAKALRQMQSVWELIYSDSNPSLSIFVHQFREKVAIFGWRERQMGHDNKAMRNMGGFTRTPASRGVTVYPQHQFGNIFTFVQVKYPAVFKW